MTAPDAERIRATVDYLRVRGVDCDSGVRTFLAVCRGLGMRPGKVLDAVQDNSQAANRKTGR